MYIFLWFLVLFFYGKAASGIWLQSTMGVHTIQALEQMFHGKSWGSILANLGRILIKYVIPNVIEQ